MLSVMVVVEGEAVALVIALMPLPKKTCSSSCSHELRTVNPFKPDQTNVPYP